MSKILIITNPAYDLVTEYFSSWLAEIVEFAEKQDHIEVYELKNEKVNKNELTALIEAKKPSLILFNGHGSAEAMCGHKSEVLIQCDENEDILNNTIIHALACDLGKKLAPQCIKIGTLSFIAYEEEFKFISLRNAKTIDEKKNDPIASLFLEPAYGAVTALVEGKTAHEAFQISQKMYVKNLQQSIMRPKTELNNAISSQLYHNLKYQVCLGDPSIKF